MLSLPQSTGPSLLASLTESQGVCGFRYGWIQGLEGCLHPCSGFSFFPLPLSWSLSPAAPPLLGQAAPVAFSPHSTSLKVMGGRVFLLGAQAKVGGMSLAWALIPALSSSQWPGGGGVLGLARQACAHCRGGIDPIGEPHGPRWAGELWEGAS